MHQIDINCDMGEYNSAEECAADVAFMPYISQCNIAVGGHIGNPDTIRTSFINANKHNLMIGLHPSYPDRPGFGRQRNNLSVMDVIVSLKQQIEMGLGIAAELGIELCHIKCHGALYNDLEHDSLLSQSVAELFSDYALAVMGMAHGRFSRDCQKRNLQFIHEAFMDRRYLGQYQLQPRTEDGAVLTDMDEVIDQALAIATNQPILSAEGKAISLAADSICVHSDTQGALHLLKAVRRQFALESVSVGD